MKELAGKIALVTGGGTGIGAAIASELAGRGAQVALVSRRRERLEETAARLREEGHEALVVPTDLRGDGLETVLEGAVPRVDVLVNNAAVFATYGPVEEVPQAEIDDVLEVDLRAVLRLVRLVLPGMKERRWGRILNVGSVAGGLGAAGQVAYATAKAGLEGLTRSVAIESAGFGVTCNLIEPGLVETARVTERIDPAVRAHLVNATPVGRPGRPEEIAFAAGYLASEAAAAVTGAVLPVSGGIGLR